MDVLMAGGVRLEVESEDLTIETETLEWRDRPRLLLGGDGEEVRITREDGTLLTGVGFRADVRRHSWEFLGEAEGVYVHGDEEEEGDEGPGAESPAEETEGGAEE
jgi:hypothetical protein